MQKPRTRVFRPELTRLPPLTALRRAFRALLSILCKGLIALCTRAQVEGLENFPRQGPALVVVNHLGDADIVLGLATLPSPVDALAKMEMYDFPIIGKLMEWYGVIWLHRGQPDRRALRAALQGFQEGRLIGIAPEGRESLTRSLEEGTGGAAFLALKGQVPIVPVTFTGTDNSRIYGNLKRLRRTEVGLTVGPAFWLETGAGRPAALREGTELIMRKLAGQLGIYQYREGE
jgi:1-acyl-sn-glycerol-3-phosphate acyltransferase